MTIRTTWLAAFVAVPLLLTGCGAILGGPDLPVLDDGGIGDRTTDSTKPPRDGSSDTRSADHAKDTGLEDGGGDTGGDTDGPALPCSPSTCATGCCTADGGECHTEESIGYCGKGGGSCGTCTAAQTCSTSDAGQQCADKCTSTNCPTGCCDSTGTCITATTNTECGTNVTVRWREPIPIFPRGGGRANVRGYAQDATAVGGARRHVRGNEPAGRAILRTSWDSTEDVRVVAVAASGHGPPAAT